MESVRIEPGRLRDLSRVDLRHVPRAALFVALYLCAATCAVELAASTHGVLGFLLRAPLYVLAAASLHGLSLFTHEGVHGGLAKGPFFNRFFSVICALPVLQNYAAYRVLHLEHHADLGGARDPDHYSNYTPRPWLVFFMNWGRLLAGYPAYVTAIPVLALRRARGKDRLWILFEVSALVSLALLATFTLPTPWLIHGWLIPMVVVNTMVNIRGMSQHTLLPRSTSLLHGSRTILTSRLVAFFMCNENYHLEHHLYPRVPWYNLPALHVDLKPQLLALKVPFIPSYSAFVSLFVLSSVGRSASAR